MPGNARASIPPARLPDLVAISREERTELPESLAEIADVIGYERALGLIGRLPRSGRRSWRVCFYVPKRLPPDHQLVRILGWHDAMRMVRHFGGEILQTSNCRYLYREYIRRRVWEMSRADMPVSEIAAAVDLTPRRVNMILKENPPEATARCSDHPVGDENASARG